MITVPVSTPEKPLTYIDYCAELTRQCNSVEDIRIFSEKVPLEVLNDERYNRAVAMRLVGAKRSKSALVNLVNWLLHEESKAELRQTTRSAIAPKSECICPQCGWRHGGEKVTDEEIPW